MELPLSQETVIGVVDNNKICAQILKAGKRQKPESKYSDEDHFRIAQYAKEHGASRAATFFKSKYKAKFLLKQKHSLTSSEKGQAQETGLWKPGTTLIVGDSMLNGVEERKMPIYVKVRNFPRSTIRDMYDYVKPLLRKRPSHVLFHVGTNVLLILILAPLSVSSLTLKNTLRVNCLIARSPYHCQ